MKQRSTQPQSGERFFRRSAAYGDPEFQDHGLQPWLRSYAAPRLKKGPGCVKDIDALGNEGNIRQFQFIHRFYDRAYGNHSISSRARARILSTPSSTVSPSRSSYRYD